MQNGAMFELKKQNKTSVKWVKKLVENSTLEMCTRMVLWVPTTLTIFGSGKTVVFIGGEFGGVVWTRA